MLEDDHLSKGKDWIRDRDRIKDGGVSHYRVKSDDVINPHRLDNDPFYDHESHYTSGGLGYEPDVVEEVINDNPLDNHSYSFKEKQLPKKDTLKPVEFDVSTTDIIKAVIRDETIGGIRITEKLQDPSFSFISKLDPVFSSELSEAFSALVAQTRSYTAKLGAAKTNEKRSENADEYAMRMFNLINSMKAEAGKLTLQATVDALSEKGILTPNGGKWHISTLQDLQKRWKKLGLTPHPPKS